MNKPVLKIFTILMLTIAFASCKDKADEAKTTEATEATEAQATSTKYMANPANTLIEWAGYKPTGEHFGTIMLESGVFTVNDNKIESGTFIINMSSIKDYDGSARLEGHLKSADFFDVENHPSAAFEVTGFEEVEGKMMLSGNLALKGKKNNVTFPVTLSEKDDIFTITSEKFIIDRSKWDVKYGSKSFFDNLGDKFINDDIELKIVVNAKKS
ncbi:YceI family protein [Flavobacteriaceae bacterium S0825]|uniref:YceI family protein n=1 Tax=Gaetbulibacter sp. S0825 TaxID=2720084 RepID=UPI0014312488|nr:YceI family protein [Gaetbulibacter sp. S0825]MCK0110321.1 YceI family protein [Flavobacteriaceae bacterium S0825]NIX65950.1 YceI family protein [Gaetbulibacter sp. S0825]